MYLDLFSFRSWQAVPLASAPDLDSARALLRAGADPTDLRSCVIPALLGQTRWVRNPQIIQMMLASSADPNQTCRTTQPTSWNGYKRKSVPGIRRDSEYDSISAPTPFLASISTVDPCKAVSFVAQHNIIEQLLEAGAELEWYPPDNSEVRSALRVIVVELLLSH